MCVCVTQRDRHNLEKRFLSTFNSKAKRQKELYTNTLSSKLAGISITTLSVPGIKQINALWIRRVKFLTDRESSL